MADRRVPVWLDCDPGHDDVFAILLACYHPAIKLLGVSTVFGNAPLEKTTWNAESVLTAIGRDRDIPVYAGASHALYRPALHAPTIHGESGLDGTELLPQPRTRADPTPALDAMAAALSAEEPGSAWLVATGAFTNAAALFMAHPHLVARVRGLSLMGGAVGGGFTPAPLGEVAGVPRTGNWTPFAEFNILADPEAADWIFSNPALAAKTTLVPLDVTHLVPATEDVRAALLWGTSRSPESAPPAKSRLRQMLVELLMFFAKTYRDVFGLTEGPPLHDPLAVAAVLAGAGEHEIPFYDFDPLLEPGSRVRERYEVKVVTDGTYEEAQGGAQTGRTLVRLLEPGTEGVRIPRGLDVPLFWKAIEDCVDRADAEVSKPN